MSKFVLGIDFGTSTNFVTYYDFDKKDVVEVANMGSYGGENIFPNTLYIENDSNFVIGDRRKKLSEPLNFFEDFKRDIVSDTVKYKVPHLGDKIITPVDIAEMVFREIKRKVEDKYNKTIDGVVITFPYAYGDKYKKRIKKASENAGLPVIRLVEEPVAAAISFGLFSNKIEDNKKEKILVFDLGGGTFDITIFEFEKSDSHNAKIEVLNTGGDQKLGGKDIDKLIAEKFREEDLQIEYSDLANEKSRKRLQNDLDELAIETKLGLSEEEEYDVYKAITVDTKQVEIDKEVTRDKFEDWLKFGGFIDKIKSAMESTLYDIDLEPENIDRIILAGGTSSIPIINKLIKDFFGKSPEAMQNLGELVGHGAGILAGLSVDCTQLNYTIKRKTSKAVGIKRGSKFQTILPKNSDFGEHSKLHSMKIKNPKADLQISFYEKSNDASQDDEKIGVAKFDASSISAGAKIYLSMYRNDNNDMGYIAYNSDKKEFARGELEGID